MIDLVQFTTMNHGVPDGLGNDHIPRKGDDSKYGTMHNSVVHGLRTERLSLKKVH